VRPNVSLLLALTVLPIVGGAAPQAGREARPSVTSTRPAGTAGTVVIPDRFLRRWDPVTVFYDKDTGPARPGPEDDPDRFVKVSPAHPGEFRWLDARTLQFRPAEPWPSLARFTVTAGGKTATLATLMAAPVETVPADGADGLDPVDQITLVFDEPLDAGALLRMATIELRSLPGLDPARARVLGRDDFTVKTLERRSRSDRAGYVLVLRQPIPFGTKAVVRLRLSLEDAEGESFKEVAFSTAEPFRVLSVGCREKQYPVTPEGTRYAREQAIRCGEGRSVVVEFSAVPRGITAVEGRNLVRLTPAVPNLVYDLQAKTLEVRGDFAWDTLYAIGLAPAAIVDGKGRPLEVGGRSEVFLAFPRRTPYVRWGASEGIVERFGPQTVPVDGRGQERVDLRIHRIEPLDRSFWPFPGQPVVTDEAQRPPGPGEEPKAHDAPDRDVTVTELQRHIATLGSPPVSALVSLPLRREGSAARFGLDLQAHLQKMAGRGEPGTYLVGLRDLAAPGSARAWMRLQVTDLSLSTSEEPHAVRFVVTALSTGQPVAGAHVAVEGTRYGEGGPAWEGLVEGTTDVQGAFLWPAPGSEPRRSWRIRRLVVRKDADVLVLDASRPPDRYADNQWSADRDTWLQWALEPLAGRGPQRETLAHIFTERPVYRPDEEVHIKGYLRHRDRGRILAASGEGYVVVEGPGDLAWRYPVTLTGAGSFYHRFTEKDLPTGPYRVHFEDEKRQNRYGSTSFQIEAYRIPRFEVNLHGPDRASLDEKFEVSLTATYYAGGRVAAQPVQWRVTQFPYAFSPKRREGFLYSSDARFSGTERFRSTPRLQKDDVTDAEGSARLGLDPAIEPTAEPRSYVVEATVTGADDQTVTATRTIPALPPFVLGLKVPRFLERAREIRGQLLMADAAGELLAGREITVRLLRREWHSHLRASDFSDGVARYMTDVVDQKVSETRVKSGAEPLPIALPIDRAGVYVVELEARDRLGRAQTLRADLYAGGDQPVAWTKPPTPVFSVATDKPRYEPGMTAALVLKSPFQTGRALAVVEAPEGNEHQWIDVAGGAATFPLAIRPTFVPRVAVHFVLVRGRIPGTAPMPGNATDLGKPATMAATAWLEVAPVAHQVNVELKHPEKARPGQTIDVTIRLTDPKGGPLPGEVTLWLVDQAVLALGKERRLDPIPDFITPVRSHLAFHDTRNLAFGAIPFAESPGGEEAGQAAGLLDRATVRKNFKVVPYYEPALQVGPDGVLTVKVALSDDLTNFKLRAKAVSGPDRFGVGTSQIAVRLPLIVQPALPRFVRPGDAFTAAAIGRVVEGEGGPGAAELRAEGVTTEGPTKRELTWTPNKPERVEFPVKVKTPPYTPEGRLVGVQASFRVAVSRVSDGAIDAFEARLPVRDDRERVSKRQLEELKPGVALQVPALAEKARPGTLRREVVVSSEPALVRMAAGLDFLLAYPYGCTEQQTSRARAYLALRKFRELLQQGGGEKTMDRAVKDALSFIPTVIDRGGLVAYWPGSDGSVSLTAWVVQFLVEAKEAGYTVDDMLLGQLTRTLEQALRSDYGRFIDGESWAERAWALAALAQAGRANPDYAAELLRRAQYFDLEGVAEVLQAFARQKETSQAVGALARSLQDGIVVRLHQGREIYGGLQERRPSRSGLILPSETRTVAEVARAMRMHEPASPRLPILTQALVTLGRDDGWGSTNANAAALLALAEVLQPSGAAGPKHTVLVRADGKEQTLAVGPGSPLASLTLASPGPAEVILQAGGPSGAVAARVVTSYVPEADGSQTPARSDGFVVTREHVRVPKDEAAPLERRPLAEPGTTQAFSVSDVLEDHVQVVNPKERHYVAVVVPLAAGMEPLNPALATAPPEAQPKRSLTRKPTYVAFLDDQVAFYYDTLPAGTFDFYFRTRATVPGSFVQPPARAEMMYDGSVVGTSVGARVTVERRE
jgi:uncharacterized protein YfaS (alpha-2-macroglobulin family)